MQPVRHIARRNQPPRPAFTLIELLIVIVVIGILVALLVPAVTSAVSRAREAEVVTELSTFDTGLVNFKSKYGVDVPSFIVLYENAANWDPATPVVGVAEVSRRASRAFIRQAWPDFDFGYANGMTNGAVTPGFMDINGDADSLDTLVLNGPECLAFFLGGVCETNVVDNRGVLRPPPPPPGPAVGDPITWWSPLGFASNPQNPFARGGNRVQPFANFDGGATGRYRDFFPGRVAANENMPEYVDPLPGQTRPYLYLSSYGGRGYQQYGYDYDPSVPSGIDTADDELPNAARGGMDKLYYTDAGETTPHNPQTYQIISPGGTDFEYGAGGVYNGDNVQSSRSTERDNITNFKKGRLD